jgi:septal ring factor EnvC (AmiA/AmiB activator)
MEKILAALAELKAYFTGIKEALSKVTAAEDRVKSLEADLATAKQTIGSLTTELQAAKTETEKAQNEATQLRAELKTAQEALAKEAQRTNDVLATQGIAVDQLPAAELSSGGAKGETAWAKYQRLLAEGHSMEAGQFYVEHAEEIWKSRN